MRSSLGLLSVISRWNKARYKRSKRDGNLNKKHFLVVGSSLVVPWFVLGSSLVFYTVHIYKVQGNGILRIVLFNTTIAPRMRCDWLLLVILDWLVTLVVLDYFTRSLLPRFARRSRWGRLLQYHCNSWCSNRTPCWDLPPWYRPYHAWAKRVRQYGSRYRHGLRGTY